jgi:hypothetical protein
MVTGCLSAWYGRALAVSKFLSAVALLLCAIATQSLAPVNAMEFGVDRPGNDLYSEDLSADDPASCEALCAADVSCTAWTFVRSGHQGPNARCHLKDPVPEPRDDACCVSGVREISAAEDPMAEDPMAEEPTADTATPTLAATSFILPDEGIALNNSRLGPFCCTGTGYVVRDDSGNPLGYVHFFDLLGQAYNIDGGRSIVPGIGILVSGLADASDIYSPQIESRIELHATAPEVATPWTEAGTLQYRAVVLGYRLHQFQSAPYFDMGELRVRIDVEAR